MPLSIAKERPMKFVILLSLLITNALAEDLSKRPRSFAYQAGLATFVDFTNAEYKIIYDSTLKKAFASATIDFESAELGFPIFDSQAEPTKILLDGISTTATLTTTPEKETTVRVLNARVNAGKHTLYIELPLTQLVEFTSSGVKSAFWMTDLTDRGYLERYLPTNFLFDRIPVTLNLKFVGSAKQKVYANGKIEELANNEFKVTYRPNLNTSCIYFHTVPQDSVVETRFSYKSIDGRELPAVVYVQKDSFLSGKIEKLKTKTLTILDELEKDYGTFPHPSITVYVAGSGGMEYSGATMASESAMGHELFHSYYARAVMPADGNTGWIDEALASWRDGGYNRLTQMNGSSKMGAHAYYNRVTDSAAYGFGARFIAYLDGKVSAKGGLKPFLRETVTTHAFAPLTTQDFLELLNTFYGESFTSDFKRYVFGQGVSDFELVAPIKNHPIHKQMSLSELHSLL
jgi:hypothetical protein